MPPKRSEATRNPLPKGRISKLAFRLCVGLPLLLMFASLLWLGREVRQEHLDAELIRAMKAHDGKKALALLIQGASAKATDRPDAPITFQAVMAQIWERMLGKSRRHDPQEVAALAHYYDPRFLPPRYLLPEDPALFQAMLERGADANAKESDGLSALHRAVAWKHLKSAQLLLEKGADPNGRDEHNQSPLFFADPEGVRLLTRRGADPNLRSTLGTTPLENAIDTEQTETLQALVESGADVNLPDGNRVTPLMMAASSDNARIVSLLLAYHPDVNAQDKYGRTPLMFAANAFPSEEIIRLLLNAGARVDMKNQEGDTALSLARFRKRANILPLLEAAARQRANAR